jgi:hypothetical protein
VEEPRGFTYVLKAPSFFETSKPDKEKGEKWIHIGISRNVKECISRLRNDRGVTDLQECYGLGGGVPVRMGYLRIIVPR